MRRSHILLVVAFAILACRASSSARYLVTSSPIDVGLGIRLCIALDPRDQSGVWWWGAGAAGCASRSTGPDVFRGEQAKVSKSRGAEPAEAGFRLGTHSSARPFIDVRLVIEGRTLRALESNDRVALEDRRDLVIPEKPDTRLPRPSTVR